MLVSALLSDSSPSRGGSISSLMGLQVSAGTVVYDAFQQVWQAIRAAWVSNASKQYSAVSVVRLNSVTDIYCQA